MSGPSGESANAVGDVEHALVGGAPREIRAEALQVERRRGRQREAALELIGHAGTSRRSRRRPALTFWRAASSLVPIRSPISA